MGSRPGKKGERDLVICLLRILGHEWRVDIRALTEFAYHREDDIGVPREQLRVERVQPEKTYLCAVGSHGHALVICGMGNGEGWVRD